MNLKKTVAIAAAAGALAAISVPAMAFENEFHGQYRLKYIFSNAENGAGGAYITPSNTVTEKARANSYFEQRARIFYTAKASDDLKLVTGFEIDSVFGDKAQASASRGNGAALESDATNIETKHVYLDFKIPSTPVRATVGIQPVKDAYKGVFFDADVAGINTVTKVGAATIGAGFFRAYDQSYFSTANPPSNGTVRGNTNLDIYALSAEYAISKDIKVGTAYYLYQDDRNPANTGTGVGTTNIHVFGVNGEAKVGKLTFSGFFAKQQGLTKANAPAATSTNAATNGITYTGYAANVAMKAAVGTGTLRTALLYTSGDDQQNGQNTAWQSVTQNQNVLPGVATYNQGTQANSYNESGMMLLNRNAADHSTSTDSSLVAGTNNKDQGLWLYTIGYDAVITPKLSASANVGLAWAARQNSNHAVDYRVGATSYNGSNFLGTEVNLSTDYKMYDNLTASAQAAYVILGGYYTNSAKNHNGVACDPENPYTARVVLTYAF